MNWTRVTPRNRCPICQHDGWCSYTGDGRSVKCMRVLSDRPTRDGGFMHTLGNGHAPRTFKAFAIPDRHPVALNPEKLLSGWRSRQQGELERFAATLNVSRMALESLGCVWAPEHGAYAFPMLDAQRRVTGIRLRNDTGDKWAVKGSRQGLFMNQATVQAKTNSVTPASSLLIVEGPTDAAAAIDLGFNVIGRPACLGCEQMIADVTRVSQGTPIYIIADNDAPGRRGAEKLQAILRRAKIITLPAKDLRAFKSAGGTKELLNDIIATAV